VVSDALALPSEVALDQLLLRCLSPWEWPMVHRAVLDSLASLVAWMPWAKDEPVTSEQRQALLARWESDWDSGAGYNYGIFRDDLLIGVCGLFNRIAPGGLEIGYWVGDAFTGQGVATTSARALCELAFSCDPVGHVEIHHDKANVASGRVAEKLGFDKVEERAGLLDAPAKLGIDCVWRMTSARWRSPDMFPLTTPLR
jgi:ribosomal-protein-serine acetyltransferase